MESQVTALIVRFPIHIIRRVVALYSRRQLPIRTHNEPSAAKTSDNGISRMHLQQQPWTLQVPALGLEAWQHLELVTDNVKQRRASIPQNVV